MNLVRRIVPILASPSQFTYLRRYSVARNAWPARISGLTTDGAELLSLFPEQTLKQLM
jgi:hypothetical protein